MEEKNLAETAAGAGAFNLLLGVVNFLDNTRQDGDVDLGAALTSPGANLTVFAPTDQAFANLAVTLGYAGGTDVNNATDLGALTDFFVSLGAPTLRAVVEYHIVGGTRDAAAIDAQAATDAPLETLGGGTIDLSNFFLEGGKTELIDSDLSVVNPNVISPDVVASNGIIHVIDNVLLPVDVQMNDPEVASITDTVIALSGSEGFDGNGADFDFLRESLGAAGLADALDGDTDLTAFAPTDDAFIGLAETLGFNGEGEGEAFDYLLDALRLLNKGNDPVDLLDSVLKYHVSPGSSTAVEFQRDSGVVETVLVAGGSSVSFSIADDGVTLVDGDPDVANPTIVAGDLPATNGIINVIDGVLLPLDLLQSDGSNDVDFEIGDNGRDVFYTGRDNDFIDAQGGRDKIYAGSGDDVVLAGKGRDFVSGGSGDDYILAENGRDKVFGGSGNDFIDGGNGRDWLSGGSGDDVIAGGRGDDDLFGGFGNDTFVFEEKGGHDEIFGFQKGRDKIDLTAFGFESFEAVDHAMSGGFFKTNIDLGNTEITVYGTFFSGLGEDDFII